MTDRSGPENPAWEADENDPRAERIGELLNEFLDRTQGGEALTVDAFVSRYPDYAEELRRHLDGLRILRGLGGSSGDDATRLVTPGKPGSGSFGPDAKRAPEEIELPELEGYEIVREIGRGGMGVVYKAIQRSTKRAVALKVLLEGPFASDASRKRFEREIELAAQLRHANIIPIYDSGRSSGRIYYAMEYVHGRPLIEHVRTQGLNLTQRLHLFLKICSALQHAHLRSVVHRDLKPGNILVDGDGEPRVHDFGLAKHGGAQDMGMSLTAQIVGTPAYMAPEQVAGDPTAIDARTDVYSLGVILFELLTFKMPYPTDVPLGEVLNNITRAEPLRPSKLTKSVRGDLETIVLKALSKRKDERYQSVAELSRDIERYLSGEPIHARRASPLYLIGKALWPQRFALTAILAIVILGLAFTYSLVSNRLSNERQKIEQERRELEMQKAADQRVRDSELKKEQEFVNWFNKAMKDVDPKVATKLVDSAQGLLRNVGQQDLRTGLMRAGAQAAKEFGQRIDRMFMDSPSDIRTATQQASEPAEEDEPADVPKPLAPAAGGLRSD